MNAKQTRSKTPMTDNNILMNHTMRPDGCYVTAEACCKIELAKRKAEAQVRAVRETIAQLFSNPPTFARPTVAVRSALITITAAVNAAGRKATQ